MEGLQAGGGYVGMLWELIPANGKNVLKVSWFGSHSEQQRVETTLNKPFKSKSSDFSFHHHLCKKCPLSSQWAVFLPAVYLPYSVRYQEKALYVFGQKKKIEKCVLFVCPPRLKFYWLCTFLFKQQVDQKQPTLRFLLNCPYLVSSKLKKF